MENGEFATATDNSQLSTINSQLEYYAYSC